MNDEWLVLLHVSNDINTWLKVFDTQTTHLLLFRKDFGHSPWTKYTQTHTPRHTHTHTHLHTQIWIWAYCLVRHVLLHHVVCAELFLWIFVSCSLRAECAGTLCSFSLSLNTCFSLHSSSVLYPPVLAFFTIPFCPDITILLVWA